MRRALKRSDPVVLALVGDSDVDLRGLRRTQACQGLSFGSARVIAGTFDGWLDRCSGMGRVDAGYRALE